MDIKILYTPTREAKIIKETFFEGIGLHTSKKSFIAIKDNPKKDGIIFVYKNIKKRIETEVLDTKQKTTSIVNDGKKFIICIEHMMSALYGLGVLNAIITVRGGREIPILSGNSYSFIEKLLPNIIIVTSRDKAVAITSTIKIYDEHDEDRYIKLSPNKKTHLQIKSFVLYPNGYTKDQNFDFNFKNSESYIKEISHARTSFPFNVGNKKELTLLLKRLKGVVIKGRDRNINISFGKSTPATYYKNEIARHKILDFLGDFKTSGVNLVKTKIELHKTGHNLNIKLANLIREEFKKKNDTKNRIISQRRKIYQ